MDKEALARTRRDAYRASSFRDPYADFVHQYFVQEADSYILGPELRQLVGFAHHDLNTEPILPQYDLVMCRNVPIYFTREHQGTLIRRLLHHLLPRGHLVLGSSEMLPLSLILARQVETAEGRQRTNRKPAQYGSKGDDSYQAFLDIDH